MDKNEGFNQNEKDEKEFENNIFDILSNEKEDNEGNKNKEFELKNGEIEIYSPEVIEHLLGQKSNKEKEENIKKEEIKNKKKEEINNKNLKERENKNQEILSFEELLERKNRNKSKKSKNKDNLNRKKESNNKIKLKKPKIDFSGRLYQPKKKYYTTESNIISENNRIKAKDKRNNKIKRNKSDRIFGYDNFINKKGKIKSKSENKNIDDNNNSKKNKKSNEQIINDFLKRNAPKKVNIKKENIEDDKNNNKIKLIPKYKKNISEKSRKRKINIIDFKKFRDKRIANSYDNRKKLINNSKSNSKNKSSKKENKNKKELNVKIIPNHVLETEIDSALKNKIIQIKIQKRNSPIKDKFEKFNTEQMRYDLMKEYSNIKPNKENGFFNRMQFYSLKRKRQQENINKLVELNKYKLTEEKREKAFNRLIDDANKRIINKNKILEEEEEKMNEEKRINSEYRRYNNKEWNKIYDERFKEYEEYKRKKLEIEREKEKIEKMIEEEKSNFNLNQKKQMIIYKNREMDKNLSFNKDEGSSNNIKEIENKIKKIRKNYINIPFKIKRYESFKLNKKKEKQIIDLERPKNKNNINIRKKKNESFNNKNIKKYEDFKCKEQTNQVQNIILFPFHLRANTKEDNLQNIINKYKANIKNDNIEISSERDNLVNNYLYNYCLNRPIFS